MSGMVERVRDALRTAWDAHRDVPFPLYDAEADALARAAIAAAYEITPEMQAVAWRAFRGERRGMLLGPGPEFKEALLAVRDAALADPS